MTISEAEMLHYGDLLVIISGKHKGRALLFCEYHERKGNGYILATEPDGHMWYYEIERLMTLEELCKRNPAINLNPPTDATDCVECSTKDAVNHPSHYTDGKIEVIDFIEDKGLNFYRGCAVKYIARAGKKKPDKEVEDLQKAVWYLNREITRLIAAEGEDK